MPEVTIEKFQNYISNKPKVAIRYLILLNANDGETAQQFNDRFVEFYDSLNEEAKQHLKLTFIEVLELYTSISKYKQVLDFLNSISETIEVRCVYFLTKAFKNRDNNITQEVFITDLASYLKELDSWYSFKALGDFFFELPDYEKSIKFYNSSLQKKDYYSVHYNIGTVYSILHNFQKSLYHYKEAEKAGKHLEDILYNYGFALHQAGRYDEAFKVFDRLSELFEGKLKEGQDKKNIKWQDWGDHCLYNLGDPKKAIEKYKEGLLQANPKEDNYEMQVHLLNAYFKAKSLEPKNSGFRITYNQKAWRLFDKLIDELTSKDGNTTGSKELANVYFVADKFQKAFDTYQTLDSEDSEKSDILMLMGICKYHLKEFEQSKEYFKKSIEISPNLRTKVWLAEAYRESEKFQEAESELISVFESTSYNIDALLAHVSLCIDIGKTSSESDEKEAIIYYKKAKKTIQKRTQAILPKKKYSRVLSLHEEGKLYYDLGYIELKLAKISPSRTTKQYLIKALEAFKKVKKGSNLYAQSVIAKDRIEGVLKERGNQQDKRQKIIYLIGVVLGVFAMLLTVFGKPNIQWGMNIDALSLSKRMHEKGLCLSSDSVAALLAKRTFWNVQELDNYINNLTYSDTLNINLQGIESRSIPLTLKFDKANLSDTVLVLLLSISFAFIILGLVFDQVSSIAVGDLLKIEKSPGVQESTQFDFKLIRSS